MLTPDPTPREPKAIGWGWLWGVFKLPGNSNVQTG